jgi:hypothetical protein
MSGYGCALCGAVFASLALFDAHQVITYGRRPPVACRDPQQLRVDAHGRPTARPGGHTLARDPRGTWCSAQALAARQRSATTLAKGRSRRLARKEHP